MHLLMQIRSVVGLYRIFMHEFPIPKLVFPVNCRRRNELIHLMIANLVGQPDQ